MFFLGRLGERRWRAWSAQVGDARSLARRGRFVLIIIAVFMWNPRQKGARGDKSPEPQIISSVITVRRDECNQAVTRISHRGDLMKEF